MRWKLFRRRLSVSAPRVIVRSHLPWPLRWAVIALVLGFSASIALWAFQFGESLAGLDKDAKAELVKLRAEVAQLREDRDKAEAVANTAESLLKTERATEERLATQLRQSEGDKLQMRSDLGFFERLIPAGGAGGGLSVRGFQASADAPGHLRYQVLVMQAGKTAAAFNGRYDLTLGGTLDDKPWSVTAPGGPQALNVKQYARVEGVVDYPEHAVVKTVQLRVTDAGGSVRAMQTLNL
jgi:hypothetical protein